MWTDYELLTSDDTCGLNIDSRQEGGTALYQVDTVIKLSSSEEVHTNPRLFARNDSDGCVIVADNSVLLLDQICQSVKLHLHFSTEVDVVSLCHEGQFLMVGERCGILHLIHVASGKTLLNKTLSQKSPNANEKTYLNLLVETDISDAGTYHGFLLTKTRLFFILYLQLSKIHQAIEIMDFSIAAQLQGLIKTGFVSTEEYHTHGCWSSSIGDLNSDIHLILGGCGDCAVSKWGVDLTRNKLSVQSLVDSSMLKGVRKSQVLDNLLYVLDEDNALSVWDAYTLIMVWFWPLIHIEDFLLSTEGDSPAVNRNGEHRLKLIALTTANSSQMRNLVVYSLPAMNLLYSLEVSDVSCLVQTGISMDTIYLLEGVYEDRSRSNGVVSMVVMRCLTEALPENRLSRLLHKRKFKEAEAFAIHFGLDVELVYKVRLNFIWEQLISVSEGNCGQSMWQELVEEAKVNLQKVQDNQYILEYCLNVPWPAYETAYEMLNYAKSRITMREDRKIMLQSEGPPLSVTEILRAQARLTTFFGAFGSEKFSGISWTEFLNNKDLFSRIVMQLTDGNIKCAQYLWIRHQVELENQFDMHCLKEVLNAIPTDIPSEEITHWFKNVFIPFVRRSVPQGQKPLSKWLENKARSLELTEKGKWPENGLEMAELYFTSRNPSDLSLASSWLWFPMAEDDNCEEVNQLRKLISNLQQLVDLYRKYNCRMPLSDFEKETTTTIVFRMLDKVLAPELIPSTLEKVVKPYIQEHNLQLEELLCQYIKDLLENCSSPASLFGTAWEAKAMAVLNCMSDQDLVFDAVLLIMGRAFVPWSEGVEQLVAQYLEMDHPKVEVLQESYRIAEMKKLLRGYGIQGYDFSFGKRFVKYILKQDLPSSLEDALKVVEAYKLPRMDIYLLWSMHLINRGRREECLNLLKSLPPNDAENLADRLVLMEMINLQERLDYNEEQKKHHLSALQFVTEILKFLLGIKGGDCLKREQYERDLKMFEAVAGLQEQFDIFLSLEEYYDHLALDQLLEEHISAYDCINVPSTFENSSAFKDCPPCKSTKEYSSESRLYKLAGLLDFKEEEMGRELALKALDDGNVEKALTICRELFENHPNAETGYVLFCVAQKIYQLLVENMAAFIPEGINLLASLYELTCQATTVCSPDLILDCAELCKHSLSALEIYNQCQLDNYGFITKADGFGVDRDPYNEWIYDDDFTEDGIVLDPLGVLPFMYEVITACVPYSPDKKQYPLNCANLAYRSYEEGSSLISPITSAIQKLLQSLQESSQLQLLLRVVVDLFGSCLLHVISNSMDLYLSEKLHEERTVTEHKRLIIALAENTNASIKNASVALLHKVFNCRVVDYDLALGYCTLLSKKEVTEQLWSIINSPWQKYDKILAVADIGAEMASLHGELEEKVKFQALITDAKWGVELSNLNISYQSVFRTCPAMKADLISTLVQNPHVTSDLLLKYCSAFKLDSDSALQLYIETLLLQGADGATCDKDVLAVINTPQSHTELLNKAMQVIPLLRSTNDLVISLSGTLQKLNPYDYETIESVLKVIQKADEKYTSLNLEQALELLQHLYSYKRTSPLLDVEQQYILEQGISLSCATLNRLPFHLLFFKTSSTFWAILASEVNEDSFPTLLLISKLMKVSLDKFYTSAVKHMFGKSLKPKVLKQVKEGGSSVITRQTDKSVEIIQACLLSITDAELATANAYCIAQELPTGNDKISAFRFCLHIAKRWLRSLSPQDEGREKADYFLKKVTMQYEMSATEYALAKYNLNSPDYLKLINSPAKLIVCLFQHNSIEQRIKHPTGRDYPDIHAAAKEIAEINKLNMNKIRDTLLEKWLLPSTQSNINDRNKDEFFSDLMDDPDLMRVAYLLHTYTLDHSVRLLLTIATSDTSPIGISQLTFTHRSRALRCALHMADSETIVSLMKIPIEKVKYHLKCCIYLAEFEMLNLPYTVESFNNSPKEGMIKGLWKNHSHEPRAVKLVTELSLEYQVYDPQLWNGILQKLLGFNMMCYLRKVLVAITSIYTLWQIPNFTTAWRSVILSPFISASCPLSSKQIESLHESFVLLFKCPIQADLDLIGIAKRYAQLSLFSFALGSLFLIPFSEKRNQQIQGFLSSYNTETVLEQIVDHLTTGELSGFASQVTQKILDYIISNNQIEKLTKTKHFPLLKEHMIKTKQVEKLVDQLVNSKCLDDAVTVIAEYRKLEGKSTQLTLSPFEILQEFINEQKKCDEIFH
ncbi:kinetochore-associated protein 1 [Protopterus annectens]|uniref:kinetochore-associated protein 1 n=1 Tax=Protopterus annectens TaxID=7888 RepID=UPI001CF96468|nr:kinetochore-associated protein 1 [Protopterus annectens]